MALQRSTAMQSETAVTEHHAYKQLLLFVFAWPLG